MPYTKIRLNDDQVSIIKGHIMDAVNARDASNAPKATIRGVDMAIGPMGPGVYVTSDVRAGWPGQSVRELAGGTLSRVAVFTARVSEGLAVATGYVSLLKFVSASKHVQTYYLEVSSKSEFGASEDEQALFSDTLSILGLGYEPAREVASLEDF